MRHNPRHDPSAMGRLEKHAIAKAAAAERFADQKASSSAAAVAVEAAPAVEAAAAAAEERPRSAGMKVHLHLECGVVLSIPILG